MAKHKKPFTGVRVTYIAASIGDDGVVAKVQRGEMKVRLGPGWSKFVAGQKAAPKRRKAG